MIPIPDEETQVAPDQGTVDRYQAEAYNQPMKGGRPRNPHTHGIKLRKDCFNNQFLLVATTEKEEDIDSVSVDPEERISALKQTIKQEFKDLKHHVFMQKSLSPSLMQ